MALVAIAGTTSCGGDGGGPQNPPPADPFFPADFLDTYMMVRDCRTSIDHDLHRVQVYINPEAAAAYMNGTYPFPPGTVCVKPEHVDEDCNDLHGYAVMRKGAPGTAPASADWEWQMVGADGKVQNTDVARCISCHVDCTESQQFPTGRDFMCTDE